MSFQPTRRQVNLVQVERIRGAAGQTRVTIELNVEELEDRIAPSRRPILL
jgi:hypothetical protein